MLLICVAFCGFISLVFILFEVCKTSSIFLARTPLDLLIYNITKVLVLMIRLL